MSDKVPTSSRLDSLSRRSTPAAKPSLKFKPKTVARRTKEERDADAPINTETKKTPHAVRGNATRGRGSTRGGRAGRALAGTHLVQSGPLASGNVLNETRQSLSRSATQSPTPDFLSKIVKREGASREASPVLDSDDEDDLTKINMNKEYRFAPEDSELFPVRAPRADHVDTEVKVKPELPQEVTSRSTTPESSTSGDVMDDDSLPTSVKDEPSEKGLHDILKEKDEQLHKKLNQLALDTTYIPPDAVDDAEHSEKRLNDHKDIIKQILEIDNKEDKFLFFQLPRVFPEFKKPEDESAIEEEVDGPRVKPENGEAIKKGNQDQKQGLEGKVGTLRVHKSGKVTMKVGNIIMDVTRGSKTTFLQEVVMLNRSEDEKASYLLGHVQDKIVVTPRFD